VPATNGFHAKPTEIALFVIDDVAFATTARG
jgi:hypothetical protein